MYSIIVIITSIITILLLVVLPLFLPLLLPQYCYYIIITILKANPPGKGMQVARIIGPYLKGPKPEISNLQAPEAPKL